MDELKSTYQELLSVFVDTSAVPLARGDWFSICPDASTLSLIKKQRMVYKTFSSGIRLGVELNQKSNPLITLNPIQTFTFLLELKELTFLSLSKDLTSPLGPANRLSYSNTKKGMPLQAAPLPYHSTSSYLPKSKSLTSLSLQNEVSGQIQSLPIPIKGASIQLNSSLLPQGLYQVLENDVAVLGTEYYEPGFARRNTLYAIIKIIQNPAFLSPKPIDHQLTIVLNPK